MRLAVVNLVPTPYREPLYQRLSRTAGLALRVFYLQSGDSMRGWSDIPVSYDAVRLGCLTPESLYPVPLVGVVNPGLLRQLERFAPDCLVVHGYSYLPQIQAMRWAIRRRIPYLLWADSNAHQLAAAGWRVPLKRALLSYFCRHAAGVLTIGSSNEAFWSYYGAPPARQFRSPLAVDNDFFAAQADACRECLAQHRQAMGLPPGRLLLFVGRFAPQKNLSALLQALELCRRAGGPSLSLALVGDGPEKLRLRNLIRRLNLTGVHLFGFQTLSDLPRFYGVADALVLPSLDEPWGLVVNEAMAAGLPVLVSRRAGCLPDLLAEGENGYSFDPADVPALADCLLRFSRLGQDQRQQLGRRSRQMIAGWDYSASLAGIHRALESVVRLSGREESFLAAAL